MTSLSLKILTILRTTTPTQFTKRGNAFAQVSVEDFEERKRLSERFSFEEVILSNQDDDTLKGECYLIDNFENDCDFYIEVKGINSLNRTNPSIEQYSLDCCAQEIFLHLSN